MNLTKRPIYQKGQTAPKKARKLANKAKKPRQGADPAHLSFVRSLPCCICWEWDLPQLSPTAAHHCIHDRHGTRKSPDSMAIPLCEGHHQGLLDTSKLALHQAPQQWRDQYGPDHHWINWVTARKEAHEASFI